MPDKERFQKTISLIDAANLKDPNIEVLEGKSYPKELIYSNRMTKWLDRLNPGASVELQIAARAQHIERWKIPRSKYPMDRDGYKRWRGELMDFHADRAGELMTEAGFDNGSIRRVKSLIRKELFKTDPESQMLEDVVCLVFLENYFTDFSKDHLDDGDKLNRIIKKTWNKMSSEGRELALKIKMPAGS
ncbi:MAG: DUF4202 domain-containing protein [Candidatus Dadabacteria bacterium]|nr:DUF4202 domain-containing protein [Candidatus Dadabacteria bacterium]NIS08748.1 DUF4202 domain-containing protein [Candidatus Dadabacteria bacterium]NIV42691.1 DUF4202 family protein [Candidatus Dadabacteria bacterium]NIX15434.1 DUF4202 family protein [Candidatus Dadabacteria bacterium]NIY22096.1 DUF4202 family protein [Candidatus Dadabacteria bacterium]